jgi:hypothetical protein
MTKVIAFMTTSVDGYIAGPGDTPGCGLGRGGERLHYWVMGGPWTYGGAAVPDGYRDFDATGPRGPDPRWGGAGFVQAGS